MLAPISTCASLAPSGLCGAVWGVYYTNKVRLCAGERAEDPQDFLQEMQEASAT